MIQIVERPKYEDAVRLLDSLVDRNAELPDRVFSPTVAVFRILDITELWMAEFFDAAKHVMQVRGDQTRLLVTVIRPDAIGYYYAHFRKFPLFQFDRFDDAQTYLDALNADPGDSPADALVHNGAVLAIYPESCQWVVYGDRDFEVAIIATRDRETQEAWGSTSLVERLYSVRQAIENLLAPMYGGDVPREVAEAFLRNYAADARVVSGSNIPTVS